jgi:circadian clock protein KaiB
MSGLVTGTDGWADKPDADAQYALRLFVAGASPNSVRAIANIRAICAQHLEGRHTLEIIDVRKNVSVAQREQIIALPLLIKDTPLPARRLIGDMSDTPRVLRGLGLAE